MKKKPVCFLAVAGAVTLGLLAGCVSLQRDYPVRKFYVLEAAPETVRTPLPDGPIVQVQFFRASPGYQNAEFVYRTGESTFESDFYNVFFTLPADQIRSRASEWLADSGRTRAVVDRASRLRPTHALEGNLVEMYGDFRDRDNPRAVIAVDFLMVDVQPIEPRIVFSKSYREELAITAPTANALVTGWEEGLRKIFTALENDLPSGAPAPEPGEEG